LRAALSGYEWQARARFCFLRLPGGDREFLAIGHTVGADVTPAMAIWSYFGSSVSGLLKQELYTSIRQNCLDVQVDGGQERL
jgi:hypothetical protein